MTKKFGDTEIIINGADDVTDDEIRYWLYFIHKYIDFSLDDIVRLYIDVDDNDEVCLQYTGTCSGEATVKRRRGHIND